MRRRLRIRKWLALGLAVGCLGGAPAASASLIEGDGVTGGGGGGGTVVLYPQTPAVVTDSPSGFSWSDAAIGAGVALGAVLGGAGMVGLARSRRLPGLAQ